MLSRPPLPLLPLLLLLVLSAIPPAAPSFAQVLLEPHGPIVVSGDLSLALPDTVAQNGVRRGTGTPGDPWVISGWSITSPPGAAAISISNVLGNLVLEDLALDLPPASTPSRGIDVAGSKHVTIREVTFAGEGDSLTAADSAVEATALRVEAAADSTCISADGGSLSLQDIRLDACGLFAIAVRGADLRASRVSSSGPGPGIAATQPGTLEIRDSVVAVTGSASRSDGATAGADAVQVTFGDASRVLLDNVTVSGARSSCVRLMGPPGAGAQLAIRRLDASRCGSGGSDAALRVESTGTGELAVDGATLSSSPNGVRIFEGRLSMLAVLLHDNGVGILARNFDDQPAAAGALVAVRQSTFQGNGVDARADPPAHIAVDGYWSDGDVEGAVERSHRLDAPPVATVGGKEAPGLGVAGVALALAGLAAARRRPLRAIALLWLLGLLLPAAALAQPVAQAPADPTAEVIYVRQMPDGLQVVHSHTVAVNASFNGTLPVVLPPGALDPMLQFETDTYQTYSVDLESSGDAPLRQAADLVAAGADLGNVTSARIFVVYRHAERLPVALQDGTRQVRLFVEVPRGSWARLSPGLGLTLVPRDAGADLYQTRELSREEAADAWVQVEPFVPARASSGWAEAAMGALAGALLVLAWNRYGPQRARRR